MTSSFSLQGKIGLDVRDFKKGAQQASDAVEDVADELDDLPASGKKAGGETGNLLSSGLVKGFAAAGGAAFIAQQLNEAMNIEAGLDRVTAQFALTAEEADRYGKLGGDLYKNAWGESVVDATRSIATVGTQLQDVGDIATDELDDITASVMAVADVFSQDFDAVVRSTGQLLRNGLAEDAEEALDIVTVAFQEGGDRAGDLLDTIDEYSQHWAKLGMDGDEALGLIIEGFNQGFRDGDKLADLLKEFGLRALEAEAVDAFDALGLAGEQMRTQFGEGGESAREALGKVITALAGVEDPLEQNRLGVELFGTQWEDLGPQAIGVLSTIENGLGDVEGAASEVAETVADNTAASFEEMKRRGLAAIQDLANQALPILETVFAVTDGDAGTAWDSLKKAAVDYNVVLMGVEAGTKVFGSALGFIADQSPWADHTDDAATFATVIGGAIDPTDLYADAIAGVETATDRAAQAEREREQALDELKVAMMESYDANRTLAGAVLDAEEAELRQIDAVERSIEVQGDSEASYTDKRGAILDAIKATDDMIVAELEANGVTLDSVEGNQLWTDKMLAAAGTMSGPLQDEILNHIARVEGIPEERMTEILTDANPDNIGQVEREINQVARPRTVYISTVFSHIGGSVPSYIPGIPGRASGGPVDAGRGYIVGEEGPEWFSPKQSGMIYPADVTAAMFAQDRPVPPSAMTQPSPSTPAPTAFANNSPSFPDATMWARQAADEFARRVQQKERAA